MHRHRKQACAKHRGQAICGSISLLVQVCLCCKICLGGQSPSRSGDSSFTSSSESTSPLSSATSAPPSELPSSSKSSSPSTYSSRGACTVSRSSFSLAVSSLREHRAWCKRPRNSTTDLYVTHRASKMSCNGFKARCNTGRALMKAQCRSKTHCIQVQSCVLNSRWEMRRLAHSCSMSNASEPLSCETVASMIWVSLLANTMDIRWSSRERNAWRSIGAIEMPPTSVRDAFGSMSTRSRAPSSASCMSRFRFALRWTPSVSRGPSTTACCLEASPTLKAACSLAMFLSSSSTLASSPLEAAAVTLTKDGFAKAPTAATMGAADSVPRAQSTCPPSRSARIVKLDARVFGVAVVWLTLSSANDQKANVEGLWPTTPR
mmetsp:Transcript_54207/g.126157  ORF Transcript_54207/g.126157 Transcript_54207/m.126157 type:complete len:376 (-) Transcript_54207:824-1951(-)